MYSKQNAKRLAQEKNVFTSSILAKHMNKVYPIGTAALMYKSRSPLSLSSLSLTLSQNSNDSTQTQTTSDSSTPALGEKIALALRLIESSSKRIDHQYFPLMKTHVPKVPCPIVSNINEESGECLIRRRCNWITNTSDKLYVEFHDECWGVPVYDDHTVEILVQMTMCRDSVNDIGVCKVETLFRDTDASALINLQYDVSLSIHDSCHKIPTAVLGCTNRWGTTDKSVVVQLFELLTLSGMLMDFNWTEILRRKQLLREAFAGFDANNVAKKGEKEIIEIASNKDLMISESRVRCIVDNSKCIVKIAREFGSFSSFMWNYVNYKPVINKNRYPGKVPLRSPKAEAISKDLLKRGFRFVGPVIVYSFMQAAGLTIDHLLHCFRYHHCVNLAQTPT